MGFCLASLGHVCEGLYEAAVGKVPAADLDNGSIGHRAFAHRKLLCRRWHGCRRRPLVMQRGEVARFTIQCLIFCKFIKVGRIPDELGGQIQKFAAPSIDDRNLQVTGYQHDALAHIFQCKPELIRLLPRLRLRLKKHLHGGKYNQGERNPDDCIQAERSRGRFVDLVLIDAHAHPQRLVSDPAECDQMRSTIQGTVGFECRVRPGLHACKNIAAAEVLA